MIVFASYHLLYYTFTYPTAARFTTQTSTTAPNKSFLPVIEALVTIFFSIVQRIWNSCACDVCGVGILHLMSKWTNVWNHVMDFKLIAENHRAPQRHSRKLFSVTPYPACTVAAHKSFECKYLLPLSVSDCRKNTICSNFRQKKHLHGYIVRNLHRILFVVKRKVNNLLPIKFIFTFIGVVGGDNHYIFMLVSHPSNNWAGYSCVLLAPASMSGDYISDTNKR